MADLRGYLLRIQGVICGGFRGSSVADSEGHLVTHSLSCNYWIVSIFKAFHRNCVCICQSFYSYFYFSFLLDSNHLDPFECRAQLIKYVIHGEVDHVNQ